MATKIIVMGGEARASRVIACLEEIGLEYNIDTSDISSRPTNLFNSTAILQDGDVLLFESRVATKYLVRKYGQRTNLLPEVTSSPDGFSVSVWMENEVQRFNGRITCLIFKHIISPTYCGYPFDAEGAAMDVGKLDEVLDMYEARLSKRKFLGGDSYSLADLHHIPYLYLLVVCTSYAYLVKSRRHLNNWWDTIHSRPSTKKATSQLFHWVQCQAMTHLQH